MTNSNHPKHELKACPRCRRAFECKSGSILECQCNGIYLNQQQRNFIGQQFNDCLCRTCLEQIRDTNPLSGSIKKDK